MITRGLMPLEIDEFLHRLTAAKIVILAIDAAIQGLKRNYP